VHRLRLLLACVLVLLGIGTASLWVGRKKVTPPVEKGGFECPSPRKDSASPSRPPRMIAPLRPSPGGSKKISLPCDVVHSYSFPLKAGESQTIELIQEGFDIAAEIIDPQVEVDGIGEWGSELIPILAAADGIYRVQVSSFECRKGSGYVLKVGVRRAATVEDRKRYEAALAYFQGRTLSQHAEEEFRKAARLWGEVGHLKGQADAFFKLGKREAGRFQWAASRSSFQQALPLYRSLGDRRQEAIVMNEIGLACERLGEDECAVSSYQEAVRLAGMTRDQDLVGTILRNLGMLKHGQGEVGEALELLREALDVAPNGGSTRLSILNALGAVYLRLGEVERALRYHQKVLRRLKSSSDGEELGATMTHLGDVYREKNELAKAKDFYFCALKLSRDAGDLRNVAVTYNDLGLLYSKSKRWREAYNAFLNAKRIFEEQRNPSSAAVALVNVAWTQTVMGRYPQALRTYELGLTPIEASRQLPAQAAVYFGMAWAEYRLQNLRQARADVEKAIAIIESIRSKADREDLRASYLAGRQNFYEFLVEILMELHRRQPGEGYDVKAFEVSDKARSRALLDALEGQPVLPALATTEVQRELLDEETVLLEYFLGENRSYLWVITSTDITSYELPSGDQIEELADKLYESLASGSKSVRRQSIRKAEDLARLLLGPVASRLGNKRLLIVVPAALQRIPFNMLPVSSAVPADPLDGWPTPLIVHHEIIHLPSAAVLASLRRWRSQQKVSGGQVCVVGDPVFSPDDERLDGLTIGGQPGVSEGEVFQRLRFSRQEADAIEKAAGPGRVRKVLGLEATRDLVQRGELREFDIVHFSAHGSLNTKFPALSAIELSRYNENGNYVSGTLRAEDIAHLDLPAGLVVLSACSTGLGKEVRGEGLLGLTQAFFTAGASRVLVSLWNIDDSATAELMERFYSNLLGKDLSPAAALQEAQVWTWKNGKHESPFYWGGFVLQGESR
jgi:CHAT domain-containing protein